jgi:hypothetical protein
LWRARLARLVGGCTGLGIWCGGVGMVSCGMWAAVMIR